MRAISRLIVNENNEAVAFVIAMPDISKGIKKVKGLYSSLRDHPDPDGRETVQATESPAGSGSSGLSRTGDWIPLWVLPCLNSARKGGLQYIDSHLEMESNSKVRAEMEYMGGEVYKTYRVFGKSLEKNSQNSSKEKAIGLSEVICG